jgi:hypothetical protein
VKRPRERLELALASAVLRTVIGTLQLMTAGRRHAS